MAIFPIFFIFKNTHRILNTSSEYEESPYPRINKDSNITIIKEKIISKTENGVFFKVYNGEKCFNIKFPCIVKNENKNFTFNKINNYLILKNLNE